MATRVYGDGQLKDVSLVTIPIPLPFQRNYGVFSATTTNAEQWTQRYAYDQHTLISEQAEKLGVTISSFIKQSAYNMARALKEKEKSHEEHPVRTG